MAIEIEKVRTSYRVEREFGLIVGGILALLACWWLYRGKFEIVAPVTLAVGSLLIVLGAVLPKVLVQPNRAWMGLAHLLSLVTTPIIFGIVFFVVVTPMGVIKRLTGWGG